MSRRAQVSAESGEGIFSMSRSYCCLRRSLQSRLSLWMTTFFPLTLSCSSYYFQAPLPCFFAHTEIPTHLSLLPHTVYSWHIGCIFSPQLISRTRAQAKPLGFSHQVAWPPVAPLSVLVLSVSVLLRDMFSHVPWTSIFVLPLIYIRVALST